MIILDMREKNSKSEVLDRVWKIRDLIQDLEDIKDKIIDFLRNEGNLDDNANNVWISDAKEFYYNIVGAWEMLRATAEGKERYLERSKGYLYPGKSCLAQSMSELKTFTNKKAEKLIFRGITHSISLRKELAEKLFDILKAENLSEVQNFMKKYHGFEGLDADCPKCDKIYCWEHYDTEEVFDDGFYDYTYGTCPEGHKRMFDD